MRIAVAGATGRTGVPLVEQALARGNEVVASARSPEPVGVDSFADRMGAPEVSVRFLERRTTSEVDPGAAVRRFGIELADLETALRRDWA